MCILCREPYIQPNQVLSSLIPVSNSLVDLKICYLVYSKQFYILMVLLITVKREDISDACRLSCPCYLISTEGASIICNFSELAT